MSSKQIMEEVDDTSDKLSESEVTIRIDEDGNLEKDVCSDQDITDNATESREGIYVPDSIKSTHEHELSVPRPTSLHLSNVNKLVNEDANETFCNSEPPSDSMLVNCSMDSELTADMHDTSRDNCLSDEENVDENPSLSPAHSTTAEVDRSKSIIRDCNRFGHTVISIHNGQRVKPCELLTALSNRNRKLANVS